MTLFVSGCRNHCFNCFQPQTWDFDYGQPFDRAAQERILTELERPYVQGLTLLGVTPSSRRTRRRWFRFWKK